MDPLDARSASVEEERPLPSFPVHHDPESARRDIRAWDASHQREAAAEKHSQSSLYALARLMVAAVFLLAAGLKIWSFTYTSGQLAARGFQEPGTLLTLAIATELCGGLLLAIGYRVRLTAAGLIGYLVAVTLLWNLDFSKDVNWALALANFGFVTALLMLLAHGAGRLSVERALAHRHASA